MRRDLPAAAADHPDWPIRLDHCFARVILDEVCGCPWRERIAAPAWRNLSPADLDAALALADAILDGRADVGALNLRSLDRRRLSRAGLPHADPAPPPPSPSANL